jgi:hypothetical protein
MHGLAVKRGQANPHARRNNKVILTIFSQLKTHEDTLSFSKTNQLTFLPKPLVPQKPGFFKYFPAALPQQKSIRRI